MLVPYFLVVLTAIISNIIPCLFQSNTNMTNISFRLSPIITLESIISSNNVNNTVLLMMTDYGYLNHFLNVYYAGNLNQYPNLVVACIDKISYHVYFMNILSIGIKNERDSCSISRYQ